VQASACGRLLAKSNRIPATHTQTFSASSSNASPASLRPAIQHRTLRNGVCLLLRQRCLLSRTLPVQRQAWRTGQGRPQGEEGQGWLQHVVCGVTATSCGTQQPRAFLPEPKTIAVHMRQPMGREGAEAAPEPAASARYPTTVCGLIGLARPAGRSRLT